MYYLEVIKAHTTCFEEPHPPSSQSRATTWQLGRGCRPRSAGGTNKQSSGILKTGVVMLPATTSNGVAVIRLGLWLPPAPASQCLLGGHVRVRKTDSTEYAPLSGIENAHHRLRPEGSSFILVSIVILMSVMIRCQDPETDDRSPTASQIWRGNRLSGSKRSHSDWW